MNILAPVYTGRSRYFFTMAKEYSVPFMARSSDTQSVSSKGIGDVPQRAIYDFVRTKSLLASL